ncbi:MAG: FeS-binding protein [Desulfamplus sp.]|nr:FeS-binding protein [Desulfamplus sp.]
MENNLSISGNSLIIKIIETCTNCDVCRMHMEDDCLFFPELYRLYDESEESGISIKKSDLRNLVDLCTMCGLCPCPEIRSNIIISKTAYVNQENSLNSIHQIRSNILSNVESIGKLCGIAPSLANKLNRLKPTAALVKRIAGIHQDLQLPRVPKEDFFKWAYAKGFSGENKLNIYNVFNSKQSLDKDTKSSSKQLFNHSEDKANKKLKVAYFSGCSASYFFPEVAKAVVNILVHNGIEVVVPQQKCCGMPLMVEGNQKAALENLRFNMKTIINAIDRGYDIVCSCPTCGFFFKNIIKENAFYSAEYQSIAGVDSRYMKIPLSSRGNKTSLLGTIEKDTNENFTLVHKSTYQHILKDDGYFAQLNPLDRIKISERVMDFGQYLFALHSQGKLKTDFQPLKITASYYAPCHQREQYIGQPYLKLLEYVPSLTIKLIGGSMDCCGIGGHLGFKKTFHEKSLKSGEPLFTKIKSSDTQSIITDCLSCRFQFENFILKQRDSTIQKVFHPVEILAMNCTSSAY